MKAQKHFVGKPKDNATKVRQVGSSSATAGVSSMTNNAGAFPGMGKGRKNFAVPSGALTPKVTVKQVGTFTGTGQKSNSKQYRDPSTRTKTNISKPLGYGPQANQEL